MKKEIKKDNLKYDTRVKMVTGFMKGSMPLFILTVVFACLLIIFDLANPKIIGFTVDYIIGNEDNIPPFVRGIIASVGEREYVLSHLYVFGLIVIGIALLGGVCRYAFKLFNSMGAEKLGKNMKDMLYEHIVRLPFSWHDQNMTGDIIQRCTSDVDMIRDFIANQLTGVLRMVLVIIVSLILMFRINTYLAFAPLVFIPIVIGYSMFFHRRIGKSFMEADTEEGKLSAIAQENLTGVRVVRAFGREKYERDRFENKNASYTKLWVKTMTLLSSFWSINDFITGSLTVIIVAVGSYLCVKGSMTAGDFVAFMSINGMMVWPVRELGRTVSEMSKAGISIDRLMYIMNSQIEQDDPSAIEYEDAVGDEASDDFIVFDNVSYSFEDSRVLENMSFRIKKGETVGILGKTGAGKTTLMNLLEGFYELGENEGSIRINGVDLRKIKKSSLRSHIGFVMQEPFLFSGTLEDNIKIASDEKTHEDVTQVAETVCLSDTIEKFSAGYETKVGERGVTLSGGQKQRTAMAQMLIRRPDIMIFDDSLSAVDALTDAKIRANLSAMNAKEANNPSTTIIISHRITTIMKADRIFVLEDGKLLEEGNHKSLIERGGRYSEIFALQSGAGEGGCHVV